MPRIDHEHDFREAALEYWSANAADELQPSIEYITREFVCSVCNQSHAVTERA